MSADKQPGAPAGTYRLESYLRVLIEIARWRLLSALALMVLFSATEGIGLMMILPVLQLAGFDLAHQGGAGQYSQRVLAILASIGLHPTLAMVLAIFVVLVSARALLSAAQYLVASRLQQDLESTLRSRLYNSIAGAG